MTTRKIAELDPATNRLKSTQAPTPAEVGAQPVDSDLTAIAALTTTAFGRALLELADAAAGRTALGLGSAATAATSAFDAAGSAAAAQAASQPVDSDLTEIAALTTTAYGRALLTLADVAALRAALGTGYTADLSASYQTVGGTAYGNVSGAVSVDAATAAHEMTLTGDTTITPTGAVGVSVLVRITQDGTGGHALALTGVTMPDGWVMPSTAAAVENITLVRLVSGWRGFVASSGDMPRTATVFGWMAPKAKVGSWTVSISTGYPAGGSIADNGSGVAINQYIEWDVALDAGTYDFVLNHQRNLDCGIYTVSIDGIALGTTVDGYNATVSNTRNAITGVTIASAGHHTVRLTMAGQNASSSNYRGQLYSWSLTRTGE